MTQSSALSRPGDAGFSSLRRRLMAGAAMSALVLAMLPLQPVRAADYPERPVTIVSAFPAGGIVDVIARRLAQGMSDRLKTPFLVDNRTGAAGSIGYSYAARAKPDGYTLVLASGPTTMTPPGTAPSGWNPATGFSAIGMVGTIPQAFVVPPKTARDLQDFVKSAKASATPLHYGSPGIGTTPFFTLELLKKQQGIALTHISYRGQPDVMIDLMRGDLNITAVTLPLVLPNVQAGKMTAIAVTSQARAPALPDVPTVYELGMPELGISNWFALMAPANLPPEIVATLSKTLGEVLQSPQTQAELKDIGLLIQPSPPEQTMAFFRADLARWTSMMAQFGEAAEAQQVKR
ncbi:MAG: tripartite tricarboxylate transporter substrate binding protein [Pseudacidovorax sp.]|nr:tripartite tricarboxylate transporter substrate binding protein [Pseudacidovorax sp.]